MTPASDETIGHYVDGEWVAGTGAETFTSRNPATGAVVGEFYRGTEADVRAAVDAADRAFETWRELSHVDRAEYLWDVYYELRDRTDELGEVVTRECGKEISEGRADVVEAAHVVEWAAGDARHPHGDVVPSEIEVDLDVAVHSAVLSAFKTTGQRCVSAERLVVHKSSGRDSPTSSSP